MSDVDDDLDAEEIEREISRARPYVLAFYDRGPRERDDPELLDRLQLEHLRHLFALRRSGKLVLNGPSLDPDSELRGMCIFTDCSEAEVATCLEEDPLVQEGFLVWRTLPWMGLPGDALP